MKILEQMVCQPRRLAAVTLRTDRPRIRLDAPPVERSCRTTLRVVEDGIAEFAKRREGARTRTVRGRQAFPDLEAPIPPYDDKRHSGQITTTSQRDQLRGVREMYAVAGMW